MFNKGSINGSINFCKFRTHCDYFLVRLEKFLNSFLELKIVKEMDVVTNDN